jgi:Flp pilus assembly pilin Flp
METITRKAVTAQLVAAAFLGGLLERSRSDDRGQASTEYAGILFVVVAIIAALIALGFTDVGTAIKNEITKAINKLG